MKLGVGFPDGDETLLSLSRGLGDDTKGSAQLMDEFSEGAAGEGGSGWW